MRKIGLVRTFSPKVTEITRAWYVVDADGLVLGRLATEVAAILRGKHRPYFAPHVDTGDHVIVVNADKVVLTSGKADDEARLPPQRLSRRPALDAATPSCSRNSRPSWSAAPCAACCPRTPSAARCSPSCKVYAGPDHPHAAQKPEPLDLPAARRAG